MSGRDALWEWAICSCHLLAFWTYSSPVPLSSFLLSTGCCAQLCDLMSQILPSTQSADFFPHVQVAGVMVQYDLLQDINMVKVLGGYIMTNRSITMVLRQSPSDDFHQYIMEKLYLLVSSYTPISSDYIGFLCKLLYLEWKLPEVS